MRHFVIKIRGASRFSGDRTKETNHPSSAEVAPRIPYINLTECFEIMKKKSGRPSRPSSGKSRLIPLCALPILLFAPLASADDYERQPSLDVLHYGIAIELSDASNEIAGGTRLQVMVRAARVSKMWLDLAKMTVESVTVGGKDRPFLHANGRLSFDLDRIYQKGEIAAIDVRYHGTSGTEGLLIGKNKYGQRVYFAENWPNKAHYWFPCIDHPSDKATMEMEITAPAGYLIVAPGRHVGSRILDGGRIATRWSESVSIPTYCMVFGAAAFTVYSLQDGGCPPLTVFAYPSDREAAGRKFIRTAGIVEFYTDLLGSFPYEKLAQVESTTRIGGMENAGAIFYAESSFQNEPVTESPVAHEIAHQWFGDSVTMSDWDHLWLSEGFATYCSALFYERVEGRQALDRIMSDAADTIRVREKTHPGPIIDPSIKDPMAKLNPYTYQKGAWVLHMLRKITGDQAFFEGLRRYYEVFKDGTVESDDFRHVMESVAGIPLGYFFDEWLYSTGWPDYRISWNWIADKSHLEIRIEQLQKNRLFDMPLEVVVQTGSSRAVKIVRVARKDESFRFSLPVKPTQVQVDPDNWLLKSVRENSR